MMNAILSNFSVMLEKITEKFVNEGIVSLFKDVYLEFAKRCNRIYYNNIVALFYYFKWSRASVDKPSVVYSISPDDIHWKRNIKSSQVATGIQSGDWDKHKVNFIEATFYKSALEYLEEGKRWDESVEYNKKLNNGYSEQELYEYFNYYEDIYLDMKNNGYDKRYPVKVAIGRDGDYILWGGKHRLSLAKLVGIEQIPVKVVIRHEQWQNIRHDYVKSKKESDTNTIVPKYRNHPDIKNTIE